MKLLVPLAGLVLALTMSLPTVLADEGKAVRESASRESEAEYRQRLDWWSLRPVQRVAPPTVKQVDWVRTDIDRFILANLVAKKLAPNAEADRRTLARRLSFAITGLPPSVPIVERFVADKSTNAYEQLVDRLLAEPHFGERWARHWMDVVHYSDTHGYEWDVPAKNAWRYRDYLIRAFNADVSYQRMVMEQLAGDLLPPRIDVASGQNEALIGPLALRLGERRHGDNAAAEGVTQEAVANMIDTIGKGFLGTTLACAQCHDHKLDAVEQRDYYALAGVLMSTRFSARTVDTVDPNVAVIDELRAIKKEIRAELARLWLASPDALVARIKALPEDPKANTRFPDSLLLWTQRARSAPLTAEEFAKERERRIAANRKNLKLLADFSREDGAAGWRWEGFGMKHGLARDGEMVIADGGDETLLHLLPAGRYSHVWSQRLAGALQSPLFDPRSPITFSVESVVGKFAGRSFIVDRALHSERMQFPNQPFPAWGTFTAGNFDTLEGSLDKADRIVYWEMATKSLNNYFPPRVGYGGASEAEVADPRSWFGVSRIVQHAAGQPPLDELERFAPWFEGKAKADDWAARSATLLLAAIERWRTEKSTNDDVRLLNEALQRRLLSHPVSASPALTKLVERYRSTEKKLQADRTVGSVAEWEEGRNLRIGKRGSYTEFDAPVERGGPKFLGGASQRTNPQASGRLEFAQRIASETNPLTARVYVNRVWHYLFGEGLVRTPDDFGHLGERPTHPELLDYLADRFVREGWSTKKLIKWMVTSAVWRQSSIPQSKAMTSDPENRLWHHMPMRRLEAEAIRDSMLVVSGRWDRSLYGPTVRPYRTAEDAQKRLFKGPLDGNGRRSIYIEMTMMEPPRFLALFNQPLPKQTVGRRDVTNVPDQALAMLNDPFVIAMASHWSKQVLADKSATPQERATKMLTVAFARPPRPEETDRLLKLVQHSAALHHETGKPLLECGAAWQDAAHAIFNLKEFIYVP